MRGSNIIVIGASQGGLAALTSVVAALPPHLNAAVFIVLHIGAWPSQLAQLLARTSQLPVAEARDGEIIELGRVYVAPPDLHMLIENARIRLVRGPKENFARPAIDPLFRSAAIAFGPQVVGVVLTGQLNDGAGGLLAIKDRGGITIAQDPAEALAPSMPLAAIGCGAVDHVCNLADIAPLLAEYDPPGLSLPPPPPLMTLEHRLSAMEMFLVEEAELETLGSSSMLTCPDCDGALYRLHDARLLRFRCRAAHAMTGLALLDRMKAGRENVIWSLVRSLTEEVALANELHRLSAVPGTSDASDVPADCEILLQHVESLGKMLAVPSLRRSDGSASPAKNP